MESEPFESESVVEPTVEPHPEPEVDAESVVEPQPIADPEPDVLDLTTLTVPVLRQRARDAGLTGYSRMKKSELIVALASATDS